jgi:hypothetical protein
MRGPGPWDLGRATDYTLRYELNVLTLPYSHYCGREAGAPPGVGRVAGAMPVVELGAL